MIKKNLLTILLLAVVFNMFSQQGGETCATATLITSIPYVATGNTSGATDDYFDSCPDVGNPGGAKDLVYKYINGPADIYVDISLCKDITDYDCQIYVYEGTCTGATVGCQEDGCQSPNYSAPYNSTITAQYLLANTTYYIIIDGYDSGSQGNYQLNIDESVGLEPPDSTNLSLFLINTFGQDIVNEPKINANMKIINNGSGLMNHPTDIANEYDGFIGIEIRGSFSASLPQKPFGLETRDVNGNSNNVSLLNMPSENDWILLSTYNDKVFFRNILSFDLFTKMGHYAPRTELCEVVINNTYNGIYVFTEKIKRDNNRVNVAKLDLDDNAGDSLTGGYIFKVDYWESSNSWLSNYYNPNYPGDNVYYVYNYPDEIEITVEQKSYIQTKVSSFEDVLWGPNFDDPLNGYRKFINVNSFIDYFIVNELARNVDGFKKSRYLHKDKDSKDSLIHAGPVWDFDWAFKNHNSSMTNGSGWYHNFSDGTDVVPPGWYIRLLQDTVFANELACRYFNLRKTILDTTILFNYIDSLGSIVNDAQSRHYTRWPILGVNVGTPESGPQPLTYAGELLKFKGWIAERIAWLDNNMPGNCYNVDIDQMNEREPYYSIYPNPSKDKINVYSDKAIQNISIYDISGKQILSNDFINTSLITINTSNLLGIYLVEVSFENGQKIRSKFVSY